VSATYFCGIPEYDLTPIRPLADIYVPCRKCGKAWELHGLVGCRYEPSLLNWQKPIPSSYRSKKNDPEFFIRDY